MAPNTEEIRKALTGTWKLVSYVSKPSDCSGPNGYPMGKDVQGYIMYTADGFMSAQLMAPGSLKYTNNDVFDVAEKEAADASRHYLAYSGPYEIEILEGKPILKHRMDVSLVPNWAGTHQLRRCELKGDELVLGPVTPWSLKVCGICIWYKRGINMINREP